MKKNTELALANIAAYYEQKSESDYNKIVDMIETGGEHLTRQDFIKTLGISEEVLDSFFDLVVRNCEGNERDTICDRLIKINKDVLGRIAKKLKYENFEFQSQIDTLEKKVSDLEQEIEGKNILLSQYQENGSEFVPGAIVEDGEQESMADQLKAEISELQSERDHLLTQIAQLQAANSDLQEKLDIKTAEYDELINNGGFNQSIGEEDSALLREKDETIASLNQMILDANEEKDMLIKQLEDMSNSKPDEYPYEDENFQPSSSQDQNEEIEYQRDRIVSLEEDILKKDARIGELEHEVYQLEQLVAEKSRQLEAAVHTNHQATEVSRIDNDEWQQDEMELPKQQSTLDFGDTQTVNEKPKKSKTGLYVILGVFFFLLLSVIVLVVMNQSSGPTPGVPTPLSAAEANQSGQGITNNVANGAATQLPPSVPASAPTATVQGEVPTAIAPAVLPQEVTAPAQAVITPKLLTPFDFRQNSKALNVTDQGLVIEGKTYKVGDTINGIRVVMVTKTFVRLLDPKNDLEFRVEIGK